jgi:hypothetical protein
MIRIPSQIHTSVIDRLNKSRANKDMTINLYLAAQEVQAQHADANVAVEDIVSLLLTHGRDCCFEINSKTMQQALYD